MICDTEPWRILLRFRTAMTSSCSETSLNPNFSKGGNEHRILCATAESPGWRRCSAGSPKGSRHLPREPNTPLIQEYIGLSGLWYGNGTESFKTAMDPQYK